MQNEPTRRDVLMAGAIVVGGAAAGACEMGMKPKTGGKEEPDSAAALRELLAVNRTKHPKYAGGLANHLSMELIALQRLGASADRLREFACTYGKALDPFPSGGPEIDASDWSAAIGRSDAVASLASFFEADIARRGREEALRSALDKLWPLVGSQAFHCMIRTAYGVDAGDDAEIAHGLAYWVADADSLGQLSQPAERASDVGELIERIRADGDLVGERISGGSIRRRMLTAAQRPGFAEVASSLEVADHTLDDIALAMLGLYVSTRDFTALHAVTGTHALRLLLPFAREREVALRYQWQALAAAFIALGAPRIDASFPTDAPDWAAVVERTLPSDDDHDAKFVYSCRCEEGVRGGTLYRLAAARRVEVG